MIEKKPISVLLTVIIVLTMVFAATQAVAECPTPISTSCPFVTSEGASTAYSIEIYPRPGTNEWPWLEHNDRGIPLYKWAYKFNGSITLAQMATCAPVCCPQTVYSVGSGGQVLDPGKGDPTTKFGLGIGFEYVVRLALNSRAPYWYYYTDRLVGFRNTSIQIKSSSKVYHALSIAGPAATGGLGALAQSECVTLERGDYPISMSLIRNQSDGYADPYSVRFFKSTSCTGDALPPDEISRPEPLVYCTGGAGQKNECIRLDASSPGCVSYYIQGTLCYWCW